MKHKELVTALVKSPDRIHEEITPNSLGLIHMIMGISGETGELLDAIKKHVIYLKPIDIDNIIEELGDIEFYLEGFRQQLGISRNDCLQANIVKLSKRYGEGKYTDSDAIARVDKNS